MSQNCCQIGRHPQANSINAQIANRVPSRKIAETFGVNYKAVQRHALKHAKEADADKAKTKTRKPQIKTKNKQSGSQSAAVVREMVSALEETTQVDFESEAESAFVLQAFGRSVPDTRGWSLEEHLSYARQIIYKSFRHWDAETRLKAVDRLHKNIELEAKRTGQFTNAKENPETVNRQREVFERIVNRTMEVDNCSREIAVERVVRLKPEVANWIN